MSPWELRDFDELRFFALGPSSSDPAVGPFARTNSGQPRRQLHHRFRRMMTNSPQEEFVFFPRSLPWDVGFEQHGMSPSPNCEERPSFISRLENLDPSTDEFLIDAGVRISPAAWKPLRPPQNVLSAAGSGGMAKHGGQKSEPLSLSFLSCPLSTVST